MLRKKKWTPDYPKVCPECGSETKMTKNENGAEVYCSNYCPHPYSENKGNVSCDPELKCSSCQFLNKPCDGCKIIKGKACNYETWIVRKVEYKG